MFMEIYIPTMLLCFLTFLITAAVSTQFCGGIKKSAHDLKSIVARMEDMPPCDMENMKELDETMSQFKDQAIASAWKNFSQDAKLILGDKVVPEPKAYFNYKDIYSVPRGEKGFSALWAVLFAMGVFAFSLTPAISLLLGFGMDILILSFGVSFASSGFVALVFTGFYLYYKNTMGTGEKELGKFVKKLEMVLPVASLGAQTGLLLEGTRQNTIAFENTAKTIANKIDDFAINGITPIVAISFETAIEKNLAPSMRQMEDNLAALTGSLVKKQEEGMKSLADAFADRLTHTIDVSINALCENVDTINRTMKELEDNMQSSITTLEASLQADRGTLAEACERVKEAAEIQKTASENISVLSNHLEATGKLVETLQSWDELIKQSANLVSESLREAIESNVETAKGLAGTMKSLANAGNEQYEAAAQAAAKFLNDVIVEMNKAMDGVGHEIADSITRASSDSVLIIDRLAEKTSQLKEEYDTYFERVENQSKTSMEDMDFHMQTVIGRFSEEAMGVMDKLEKNITNAMGMFEGNTVELLASLEEQSRSIGLYAHDLNIDIAVLSASLRESVQIFTDQVHNGVSRTFQDFDEGLTEVSGRLANTVESIRESVENLPKALRDGK